jgi:hypothetical protein
VEPVTSMQIEGWSNADLDALPDLEEAVARAYADFVGFTGVRYEDVTDPAVAPRVRQAVQGLVELAAAREGADYRETLADFDLIQQFSVEGYSETRRSPEEALKARMLVAWPWLNDLLRGLMTPEKLAAWEELYEDAPHASVTEVDWGLAGARDGNVPPDGIWGA